MTQQEQYWKELAESAMTYIDKCPCDPDITPEQLTAWNELLAKREEIPPDPAQGVEEAILALQKAIQMAEHDNEDPLATSWPEQTGVLISLSDAKKLLTGSRWQQGHGDYSDIGNGKTWDEMTDLQKANYQIMKLENAVAVQKNTINRLRNKLPQPAPTCCARWVKESERLPEIGSYVEAWSDPKMDFSSTNITITRFTRYGFEGAANVTHWRNIIGPDEFPCTCSKK